MPAVRNHFGWRNKTGTEGPLSPEGATFPPSAATERDAPLTTHKASRSTPRPRFYTVELEYKKCSLFVTGTADSELQVAQIIGRKWPEWTIVAVREET